jgi:hypothetical protein
MIPHFPEVFSLTPLLRFTSVTVLAFLPDFSYPLPLYFTFSLSRGIILDNPLTFIVYVD